MSNYTHITITLTLWKGSQKYRISTQTYFPMIHHLQLKKQTNMSCSHVCLNACLNDMEDAVEPLCILHINTKLTEVFNLHLSNSSLAKSQIPYCCYAWQAFTFTLFTPSCQRVYFNNIVEWFRNMRGN